MTVGIMMSGSITLVSKRVRTGSYGKRAPPQKRKNRLWLAYVKFTSGQSDRCRRAARSATGGDTSSYGSIMHYSRKLRPRSVSECLSNMVVADVTPRISLERVKYTRQLCDWCRINNLHLLNYG